MSEKIQLKSAITQWANVGSLVHALHTNDYNLFSESLNDVIIEPQRAQLIPSFYKVKEAALKAGVLGCSISGAGPSIFALSANQTIAEQAGEAMQCVFDAINIKNELFTSTINQDGAILM